ncbi:MAG: gamma-glutamylcyclotransferase family protein [Chloroflexota bacterium]
MTDTVNYVFGYGSLIERGSRTRTNPSAEGAPPVIVDHIARGWWINGVNPGFSTCFLGVQQQPGARCNGVVYALKEHDFVQLDKRERMYNRVQIPIEDMHFLDGSDGLPDNAVVWTYAVPDALRTIPTPDFPIIQSYVDTCINGCFEVEEAYPLAKAADYARMFIEETADWSHYWENDRMWPRRPWSTVPRAFQIDGFLQEMLPELFAMIKLQPARWDD